MRKRIAMTNIYRQAVCYARLAICIAITLLIWGGAVWFGSLAWDRKNGSILALMGFLGWLFASRYFLAGSWFLSIEVIKKFWQVVSRRYLNF